MLNILMFSKGAHMSLLLTKEGRKEKGKERRKEEKKSKERNWGEGHVTIDKHIFPRIFQQACLSVNKLLHLVTPVQM